MLEKIYGLADFIAAVLLLYGGVPAPAILLYACAVVLALKGTISFIPIPFYMPTLLMCGTDIISAALLTFSGVFLPIKIIIIIILLLKSVPGTIFVFFGK